MLRYPEITYDDGITMLYFNTAGKNGGSQELRNMLSYIQESTPENAVDAATQEVHSYVEAVKNDPGQEDDYMTFGDILDREKEEGIRIGETRGKEEGIRIGETRGKEEGIRIGETRGKLYLILKKREKGYSVSAIAEQLEESEKCIQRICDLLDEYKDYDLDDLIDMLLKEKGNTEADL